MGWKVFYIRSKHRVRAIKTITLMASNGRNSTDHNVNMKSEGYNQRVGIEEKHTVVTRGDGFIPCYRGEKLSDWDCKSLGEGKRERERKKIKTRPYWRGHLRCSNIFIDCHFKGHLKKILLVVVVLQTLAFGCRSIYLIFWRKPS